MNKLAEVVKLILSTSGVFALLTIAIHFFNLNVGTIKSSHQQIDSLNQQISAINQTVGSMINDLKLLNDKRVDAVTAKYTKK